ncbi:MAG TPA: hypothetical protein VF552_13020, partial [Allosphingosinicella sp.]
MTASSDHRPIITPAGIIIDGGLKRKIEITGTLSARADLAGAAEPIIDLSYLAGAEGGPLPPLILKNCVLDSLSLAGSHFAHVRIENCLIRRIDADHCRIDNHFRLAKLAPRKEHTGAELVAQIRMVAARVDGAVDLRGSTLRAPSYKAVAKARHFADRYALSLASAEIAGRLLLDDGFQALGGVSLFQATVRNSVSLRRSRLESRDISVPALDAQEFRVSGSFNWIEDAADVFGFDWHVAGRVVLRRAQIGGDCKFEHCRWATNDSLSMAGGAVNHLYGQIDARHIRVDGQFRIERGCRIARWVRVPADRAAEDIASGIYGPAIDCWKAVIAKGVRIEQDTELLGPIFLNDCSINHGLIMHGTVKLPDPGCAVSQIPEAMDLSDSRIGGLVRMECDLGGSLTLRRARVDGDVEFHHLAFSTPVLEPGDPSSDSQTGRATLLDMTSAEISGALHIGELSLDWTCRAQGDWPRSVAADHLQRIYAAPDDYRADAAAGTRPESVAGYEIAWHDGIPNAADGQGTIPAARVLRNASSTSVRLPADSYPQNAGQAIAFARRFMQDVIDDRGSARPVTFGAPERVSHDPEADWRLPGCRFQTPAGTFAADLQVRFEKSGDSPGPGMVVVERCAVTDLSPIGSPPPPFYRAGALTLLRQRKHGEAVRLAASGAQDRLDLEDYLRRRTLRPVIIDLRGLSCKRFDDVAADVWDGLGERCFWRLLLDGIDFVHFDRSDPKSKSKRISRRECARERIRAPEAEENGAGWLLDRVRGLRESLSGGGYDPEIAARARMLKAFAAPSRRFTLRAEIIHFLREYSHLAKGPDYSSQPFETFARAYYHDGDRNRALEVAKERAKLRWAKAALNVHAAVRHNLKLYLFILLAVS